MIATPKVLLIVGLGNPGKEYEKTYHNAGVIFIDYLAAALGAPAFKKVGNFEYAKTQHLILAKALVYMNDSGAAVASAMQYFKIRPDDTLVVHDDSDITIGKFKLSAGQRPAGHHGIESVTLAVGSSDFPRIRIGVRPVKEIKRKKAGEFVLKKISPGDRKVLESVFQEAASEIL